MLAEDNIAQFKSLGVKKIVALSPHSYNAMKNDYPKHGGKFEILHYTQLLQNLINEGKLKISGKLMPELPTMTLVFSAAGIMSMMRPEQSSFHVPGIQIVEMEKAKVSALCCGGGGGNFYIDSLGGSEDSPARRRVREARETGANVLAVACPNCLTMLEDAVKAEGLESDLAVKDVSRDNRRGFMNIITFIKRVPDTSDTDAIKIDTSNKNIEKTGLTYKINDWDEYVLETGRNLRKS